MKKFLTVGIALLLVSAAFAQDTLMQKKNKSRTGTETNNNSEAMMDSSGTKQKNWNKNNNRNRRNDSITSRRKEKLPVDTMRQQ